MFFIGREIVLNHNYATECSFISLDYKWNCREAIFWFERIEREFSAKNNRVVTCDIEVRKPVKDDRS